MSRIISLIAGIALLLSIFFSFPAAAGVLAASTGGASEALTEIEISSAVFPDDSFRQFILDQGYDQDSDMKLSASELACVTVMDCEGAQNEDHKIRELTGIENFRSLTTLICRSNLLQELDVSELPELAYLDCSSNLLSSLNVSGNDVLETIICSKNSLTSLNASGCYSLVSLECGENDLTTLDISDCPQLDNLSCSSNSLTVLDVTSTPLIRNYILTTPRVDNGSHIAYGEYEKVGAGPDDRRVVSLYHVEMDPETAPYSNDTGRSLDTGINADPFLITTIIFAYMLTGHFAGGKKDDWTEN